MVNILGRRLAGFLLPAITAIILIVLLIVALSRLSQIQQDMRSNIDANMLWVLSQTQVTALRAKNAVQSHMVGTLPADELEQAFALLDSRLGLLLAGPQARVLNELDASGTLPNQIARLAAEHPLDNLSEGGL